MTGKFSALKYLWYGTAFLAADVACVWILERWFVRQADRSLLLALPLAFCLLHLVTVAALMSSMIYVKARREWLAARALRLEPELQKRFSEHACGSDQTAAVRFLLRKDRTAVERSLVEFMPTVKGQGRDRLAEMAADLGFVKKWNEATRARNPERRIAAVGALALVPLAMSRESLRRSLRDREPEVRILASRALVQSRDQAEIEGIFLFTLGQTLRVRACLAEDLRKHASTLCAVAVPKVLASGEAVPIGILIEMLGAWQRSIPLEGWADLLASSGSVTRRAIFRLLPYISTPAEAETQVLTAFRDEDAEVRRNAASVAGQWELSSALPGLTSLLLDTQADVARAAAQALSKLGKAGERILEEAVLRSARCAAGAALEALEYFQTGRVAGTAL